MEGFAREFLRRIDPEFAADGDLACGVVKHICRAFGQDAIALRVGIGAKAKENLAGVVHVDVMIDHDHILVNIICPMPQSPCMIL